MEKYSDNECRRCQWTGAPRCKVIKCEPNRRRLLKKLRTKANLSESQFEEVYDVLADYEVGWRTNRL